MTENGKKGNTYNNLSGSLISSDDEWLLWDTSTANFKNVLSSEILNYLDRNYQGVNGRPLATAYRQWVASPVAGDQSSLALIGGIAWCVNQIGTSNALLTLPAGTYSFASNYTIPSNVCILPMPGCSIRPASGVAVTVNALSSSVGPYQWIDASLDGSVVFGTGAIGRVFPEWWGAIADGTTDCTVALQSALDSWGVALEKGGEVKLSSGTYATKLLHMRGRRSLRGNGKRTTILKLLDGSDDNLISFDDAYCVWVRMSDFTLDGNASNQTSGSNSCGLYMYRSSIGSSGDYDGHYFIENVETRNFLSSGIYLTGYTADAFFHGIESNNNLQHGITLAGGHDSHWVNCQSGSNQWSGFYLSNAVGNHFMGCKAFLNGQKANGIANWNGVAKDPGWAFRASTVGRQNTNTLVGCSSQENYGHGFYLYGAQNETLTGCVADGNSITAAFPAAGSATYDGFNLSGCSNITISGALADDFRRRTDPLARNQRYGAYIPNTNNNINIDIQVVRHDADYYCYYGATSTTDNNIRVNGTTIDSNEPITAWVPILPVNQNEISFAWQNPNTYDIIVVRVLVEIRTAAGAAATLDVGRATDSSGTGLQNFFLDGADISITGTLNSMSEIQNGTAAVGLCPSVNAKGGTSDYVVGKVMDANATSLSGYAYITYQRRR